MRFLDLRAEKIACILNEPQPGTGKPRNAKWIREVPSKQNLDHCLPEKASEVRPNTPPTEDAGPTKNTKPLRIHKNLLVLRKRVARKSQVHAIDIFREVPWAIFPP